jgi:hypothetical protein
MGTGDYDRSGVGFIEVNDGSGFEDLGTIKEAKFRVNGEPVKHFNVQGLKPVLDAIEKGNVELELEFTWEDIAKIDFWHRVLYGGTMVTTNAGTEAVTDEVVTLVGENWTALLKGHDIDDTQSVTVSSEAGGGGTDYTEGTDYKLDPRKGHIKRIAGGAITDGQTVYVDWTRKTFDGKKFNIHENDEIPVYQVRWTKYLKGNRELVVYSMRASFSIPVELGLTPGETGEWAGVPITLAFLYDENENLGPFGSWEIRDRS